MAKNFYESKPPKKCEPKTPPFFFFKQDTIFFCGPDFFQPQTCEFCILFFFAFFFSTLCAVVVVVVAVVAAAAVEV